MQFLCGLNEIGPALPIEPLKFTESTFQIFYSSKLLEFIDHAFLDTVPTLNSLPVRSYFSIAGD